MSRTLVLGASTNNSRFSYKCVKSLLRHEHEVVAVGLRKGKIADLKIRKGQPHIEDVHTIILYIGPKSQVDYYDYILGLKPRRIIFNPGTYNKELIDLAQENDIDTVVDCSLIMLNSGTF